MLTAMGIWDITTQHLGAKPKTQKHRKLVLKSGNKNPPPSKYFQLTLHTETERQRELWTRKTLISKKNMNEKIQGD
jgi:hypothetical protein